MPCTKENESANISTCKVEQISIKYIYIYIYLPNPAVCPVSLEYTKCLAFRG